MKALLDRLYGYDYFISYAHSAGTAYPDALKSRLEQLGFSVFIDRERFVVGGSLAAQTLRSLKASTKVVLIGTPDAFQSKWVKKEIELARVLGKPIALVDINSAFANADSDNPLKHDLQENIHILETCQHADTGPSDHTVGELFRSFTLLKREKFRQRIFASVLLAIAISSSALAGFAEWQRRDAISSKENAQVSQSLFLADIANELTEAGNAATAALVAAEALPDREANIARPEVFEAKVSLYRALNNLTLKARFDDVIAFAPDTGQPFSGYAISADFTNIEQKKLYRLQLFTGEKTQLRGDFTWLTQTALSGNGELALLAFANKPLELYSFEQDKVIAKYGKAGDQSLPYSLAGFETVAKSIVPAIREGTGFVLLKSEMADASFSDPNALGLPNGVTHATNNSAYVVRLGQNNFAHVDGKTGEVRWRFQETDPDYSMQNNSESKRDATFRALSPNGRYFIVGDNGGAYLWDLEKQSRIANMTGQFIPNTLQQAVFLEDHSRVAMVAVSGGIWLWDIEQNALLYSYQPPVDEDVQYIKFSDEESSLNWMTRSGKFYSLREDLAGHSFILALSQEHFKLDENESFGIQNVSEFTISNASQTLAIGNTVGSIRVIPASNPNAGYWLTGHSRQIDDLRILDEQQLLLSRALTEVRLWSLEANERYRQINLPGESYPIVIVSEDETAFFTKRGNRIGRFDLRSGERLQVLEGYQSPITQLASIGRDTLVSSHEDGAMLRWNTATGDYQKILDLGSHIYTFVYLQIDDAVLVQSYDNNLTAYALENGDVLFDLPDTDLAESVTVGDNGRILTYGTGYHVKLWNARTGALEFSFPDSKHDAVFWNQDKSKIYKIEFNTISVFDLLSNNLKQDIIVDELTGSVFADKIKYVLPSNDSNRLFIGLWGGDIAAIQASDGKILFRVKPTEGSYISAVELPAYDAIAITSDNGNITLLDQFSGTTIEIIKAHEGIAYPVIEIPDYGFLSKGSDQTINLWQMRQLKTDTLLSELRSKNLHPLSAAESCKYYITQNGNC